MYSSSRTRGVAFTALLMALTATAAVAQDTITVSSPMAGDHGPNAP